MTFQVKTTVLPGHRIEIQVPGLPVGAEATVLILTDGQQPAKRSLDEVLAERPGRHLFRSAEEVDAYLREERDSWDR
jgi:hypothetical protein